MPKRNYGFEKRQKEMHKQQKREEKRLRKLERTAEETRPPDEDVIPGEPAPEE